MAKSSPVTPSGKDADDAPSLPASPLYTTTKGSPCYPAKAADVPNQFAPTAADPRPRRVKYATGGG